MDRSIGKKYSNSEITVVWKPALCVHSTNCWKSLVGVFDPRRKPWIDMQAAGSAEIAQSVDNCPSGALTYVKNRGEDMKEEESKSDVEIKAASNGPYLITGDFTILDADNNVIKKVQKAALCRCGSSKNKPFCDGTHKSSGFEG